MRARYPDTSGSVVRDGVALGFEVYGEARPGRPTILLLPTWTIIHARFWKMQIPYLARHFRVVAYDGPGNGRSDRSVDPARYTAREYALDAVAVLEACEVDRVVAVGLSRGAWYALELAALRPDIVSGLVLVGAALPLTPALEQRSGIAEHFLDPAPQDPQGWDRYNLAYWHAHYPDFARWFFEQVFPEPHSTKALEDAVVWAMASGPDVLEAEALQPSHERAVADLVTDASCPTLVVHGTDDMVISHDVGVELARLSGGAFVSMEGSGHMPNIRDPVRFNLVLSEFVERVSS